MDAVNTSNDQSVPFSGQSAHLNVEGNMETPLLGRNMDDSTPLSQHDNVCIRVPARILNAMNQAILEVLQGLGEILYAIKEATVGTPGRILGSLVLFGGISLAFVAATRQEFNPLLVIAAALTFVLSTIIFRLESTRS